MPKPDPVRISSALRITLRHSLTPAAYVVFALSAWLSLTVPQHSRADDLTDRLPTNDSAATARLAIVIDDVGYSLRRAEELMALPKPLTLGLLPYAPYTVEIAARAHAAGREIILHQPMEPVVASRMEPGTLALDMSQERFEAQFEAALERLPNVTGVNNHTGSLLTAHRLPMERLMTGIARRGLYFLDSRTTPHTVAESTARAHDVPTIRRDVFLDHIPTNAYLEAAFDQSIAIARRRGKAVVIAHPYPITVAFLEGKLRTLPADVTLTTLSDLVAPSTPVNRADRGGIALLGSPVSPSISLGQ